MADDSIAVLAGDCTVSYEGEHATTERGAVVVLVKPDGTVLVHDRAGYRPAAWLTRAASVSWTPGEGGTVVEAVDADRRLSVACHAEYGSARYAASHAGAPAGTCPDCGGALVHAAGAVACLGCDARYSIPRDATLLDATCSDCGLPRMRVERGDAFDCCVDRGCESLDRLVRERFDREWSCPACGGDLRVLRRGGLIAGCEGYPACESAFSIPSGRVAGACDCGLPVFETPGGRRCLDATCAELP